MFTKKILFIVTLTLCFQPIFLFSQISEFEIEQIYESSEEFDYSEEQIDYIEFTRLNKINLLNAKPEDLTKLPLFDINTANQITEYVRKHPNTTIEILSKELSLRGEQIILLENCTYIKEQPIIEKLHFLFRSRYKTTNDPVYGFEKSKFLGNQVDLSTRFKLQINDLGTNFIVDKDAGERSFIDYYSGNIWYNNRKNLSIVIGDFEYQLGLGNILWKSFGDRKGINNIAPALRFQQSNKPYFSTLDYSRFRGASIDYLFNFNNFLIRFGGFYSNFFKSATYDTLKGIITSIYTSGLYRTHTEIRKKDTFKETAYSGNLSLTVENLTIGSGLFQLLYNNEIQTTSSKYPNSPKNLYKTFFALFNNKIFSIGSELSFDEFNNHGFTMGSIYNFNKSKFALQIRSFGEFFRSPYGNMFGEFSYPANEFGIYFGFYSPIYKNIKLTSFLDLFKSYGKTYSIDKQIKGLTFFSQLDYSLLTKLKGSSRLAIENKTNRKKITGVNAFYQETDFLLRQEIIYSLQKSLNIRIRGEITYIDNQGVVPNEWGYANFLELYFYNDFVKLGGRLSLFSTDSYNSAIWQYEYFMQGYMYSFPAYLNGSRYVAFAKINIINNLTLDFVYNYTRKNNVKTLGSGNDEILRNYSNNLFLQININY